ncbi:MAG: UDP-glucose 4-epimerase GalE [Vicinamibacteria bacterium]|nr:UDP-glucose 4-epimerase GalE [Vicinamibacteria bacterium]
MKVAVTGGAGYIGSHAVAELLSLGHQVTVIDDLSAGHLAAVPESAVRFVRADIGDLGAMTKALDRQDALIHFAGLLSVGGSMKDPRSYFETNLVKGMTLLDAAKATAVRRFIFSSTCATYGVPHGPLTEDHTKEPVNPYGASKRAFEQVLEAYARIGQVRAIALRYFNDAGARRDGSLGEDHAHEEHLIPLALDAAAGRRPPLTVFGDDYETPDGTCLRDYVHVDDLARAHVLALEAVDRTTSPFTPINLGTGHGTSVRAVVQSVERVTGMKVPHSVGPRRAGDPPALIAVPERSRTVLGFEPAIPSIDEIVETAWTWRKAHPQGYSSAR